MKVLEKQTTGKDGFTLVEAMIAIILLVIGLGAAALTFNMSRRSISTNRAEMSAMHFARNQLESLRSVSWDDATLSPGTYTLVDPTYTGQYIITDAGTDLRDISMTVNYPSEMAGTATNLTLTTTLTKALHQ